MQGLFKCLKKVSKLKGTCSINFAIDIFLLSNGIRTFVILDPYNPSNCIEFEPAYTCIAIS